ncbi:MAG: NupC/NupG family nucleoside CNT transporter [Acidobacteria bacterium]|nr:NupC/NupG family nucleoside CNT transporter [Acidobacteriota bacterium]
MGLLGLVLFLAIAYGLSSNRQAIRLSTVLWGLGLQVTLAVLVLRTPVGRAFQVIGNVVNEMMHLAEQGSSFVFGDLGNSQGPMGIVLAFQILPLIIFVSSLFAVLYYLGIMQHIVRGIAIVMQRVMGASGAESLNMAANIFMGQSEAPLTIRPYLEKLTRSELMTVMTGGMATISGALLIAYVRIGGVPVEHMLTAVIMTAPAAILMAKMIEPETEQPETFGRVPRESGANDVNVIDAAARGASEGLYLALNVGAVLIAFVALIAVGNGLMAWLHGLRYLSWFPESLQSIFAFVFAPIAWCMGVPWADAGTIGDLLGTRMVINEFVAYAQLGEIRETLQPHSFLIAAYALCGFANFGSIGIQVGGIASLIPSRRHDLAVLGFRAMLAGTMANFMTASLAGLIAR